MKGLIVPLRMWIVLMISCLLLSVFFLIGNKTFIEKN